MEFQPNVIILRGLNSKSGIVFNQRLSNLNLTRRVLAVKIRIALLTISCLALAVGPAVAQNWLYDNGGINGTTDAWTINGGYVVSDTFYEAGGTINFFYI